MTAAKVETPGDRIVRELEQLPHPERMEVVAKVLERMGMTAPGRSGSVSRTRRAWFNWGGMALGAAFGIWLWFSTQAWGRLELTTEPARASVAIDGYAVRDLSRSSFRLKSGSHTLSVTSPGYTRSDESIVLSADQTLRVHVKLEGSPSTGFEIISEPPNMRVWLDGESMMGPSGPIRTNFRASKIPPGRHLLELKGDNRTYAYWRKAVMIEPDQMAKIHAVMAPDPGGGF